MRRRTMLVLLIVTAVAAAAVGGAAGAKQDARLNLVAYSTPKPVMTKIISDFQPTPPGRASSFNAVVRGLDRAGAGCRKRGSRPICVFLSTGTDINLLVDQGLLNKNWDKQSYKGVAVPTRSSSSRFVTATRRTSRAGTTS